MTIVKMWVPNLFYFNQVLSHTQQYGDASRPNADRSSRMIQIPFIHLITKPLYRQMEMN